MTELLHIINSNKPILYSLYIVFLVTLIVVLYQVISSSWFKTLLRKKLIKTNHGDLSDMLIKLTIDIENIEKEVAGIKSRIDEIKDDGDTEYERISKVLSIIMNSITKIQDTINVAFASEHKELELVNKILKDKKKK